jgi:hypothetical protein
MRQGRHSRRKFDWGTEPSRSAERSAVVVAEERDPSKRSPGRKDKAYCKPAHGPHLPVLVVPPVGGKTPACGWRPSWSPREREWEPGWTCFHQQECTTCGKYFRRIGGEECPDWHPLTAEEVREIDARNSVLVERRIRRKPVITGPQGYRRKSENR